MNKKNIIQKTEDHIRKRVDGDFSGHDFLHIDRVRNNALKIAKKEGGDKFIVELAALLHDIADWKFHKGDEKIGPKLARQWLEKFKLDKKIVDHISEIVNEVSFKGAKVKSKMKTLEGKIVQDADKLEAIGAIGIARTFAYGGSQGFPMYIPGAKPVLHTSFAEYKKGSSSTINHFYEKLLLLKDRMHTKTAKKMAAARHKFMEQYLEEFYKEWEQ